MADKQIVNFISGHLDLTKAENATDAIAVLVKQKIKSKTSKKPKHYYLSFFGIKLLFY
jgi:hypothetical protein